MLILNIVFDVNHSFYLKLFEIVSSKRRINAVFIVFMADVAV